MSPARSCFHYTSEKSLEKIRKSHCIRKATKEHEHFGKGTYFTGMHPSEGQRAIAINNWTQNGNRKVLHGKAAIAIEVELPGDMVQDVGQGGRDIILYPGGPVNLNLYRWKVWKTPIDKVYGAPLLPQEVHEPANFGRHLYHGIEWV